MDDETIEQIGDMANAVAPIAYAMLARDIQEARMEGNWEKAEAKAKELAEAAQQHHENIKEERKRNQGGDSDG